ncbi:MAG: channel protein TolC [Candidatus Solibacter sp.]|nr:channel protein TolC [Candidatus Solibacter sp.]
MMRRLPRTILPAALVFAPLMARQAALPEPVARPAGTWLTLERVLQSVETHYPPLLAALQDKVLASADLMVAEGRFDMALRGGYDGTHFGAYPNDVYRASVEKPLEYNGMTLTGGYQLGQGTFAGYDGRRETDTAGEFRTGLRAPLLRDRAMDPRRADLYKAVIGRRIADLGVDQQRLAIIQMAARRYYDWVASGRRLEAAEAVLKVAEERDQQLKDASEMGQIPRIDVTDNLRAILTRRNQVIEARRALELAAIDLSLYYRDGSGRPTLAESALLPPDFPALKDLTQQRLADDVDLALMRRPEVRRFTAQKEQVEIDRKLARNQLLPNVDVAVNYSRNAGGRIIKRGPDELLASLIFDLPIERRQAKGRDLAAVARIRQFDERERFARDQITAEVQDAYSAVKAAYGRVQVLRQELEVARQLEEAERARFQLGDGTLFLVNLREQATFDTAIRELAATNEYFRAWALYEYAIAEALRGTP